MTGSPGPEAVEDRRSDRLSTAQVRRPSRALQVLRRLCRIDRAAYRARMPSTTSFPSGHLASAAAFAVSVGEVVPRLWLPLPVAAGVVRFLASTPASTTPATSAGVRRSAPWSAGRILWG
jgi:hypothetical protein